MFPGRKVTMGFWGRFGRICKRPKHVLYALTLYAVIGGAGCSSKSSKGDKEELEEIRSWIAITELNVYQWIRESTPDQYTRKVLQKAQENLKKLQKNPLPDARRPWRYSTPWMRKYRVFSA